MTPLPFRSPADAIDGAPLASVALGVLGPVLPDRTPIRAEAVVTSADHTVRLAVRDGRFVEAKPFVASEVDFTRFRTPLFADPARTVLVLAPLDLTALAKVTGDDASIRSQLAWLHAPERVDDPHLGSWIEEATYAALLVTDAQAAAFLKRLAAVREAELLAALREDHESAATTAGWQLQRASRGELASTALVAAAFERLGHPRRASLLRRAVPPHITDAAWSAAIHDAKAKLDANTKARATSTDAALAVPRRPATGKLRRVANQYGPARDAA